MAPRLRLSRLRDIGWKLWDPIEILSEGDVWDGKPFADEYDGYLVQAAGQLRRGTPAAEVVDYLCGIEADHMGLGPRPDAAARAWSVVRAIEADGELWTSGDD